MINKISTKELGSIMIVTGTEVGAGILALPIITAKLGFFLSAIIMFIAWCLMTYTALLIADISLSMPKGSSFTSIAKQTLGLPGAVITWTISVLLMYCISVAYISAAASTFNNLLTNFSYDICAIVFVVTLGGIVVIGTLAVDMVNRILLIIKIVFLVASSFFLLQYLDISNLMTRPLETGRSLAIAIPIIITSFASHIIIPTLTQYLDKDAKALFRVIFYGTLIPLLLYLLWLASILGMLPLYGDISFMNSIFNNTSITSANVGNMLQALDQKITTTMATISLTAFANISVITSYLGVSLAFFHFNIDSYNLRCHTKISEKFIAIVLTFIIPLCINIISPNFFINAISYVGICIGALFLTMPCLIAYQLSKTRYKFYYKISQSRLLWLITYISGIGIIAINFV